MSGAALNGGDERRAWADFVAARIRFDRRPSDQALAETVGAYIAWQIAFGIAPDKRARNTAKLAATLLPQLPDRARAA